MGQAFDFRHMGRGIKEQKKDEKWVETGKPFKLPEWKSGLESTWRGQGTKYLQIRWRQPLTIPRTRTRREFHWPAPSIYLALVSSEDQGVFIARHNTWHVLECWVYFPFGCRKKRNTTVARRQEQKRWCQVVEGRALAFFGKIIRRARLSMFMLCLAGSSLVLDAFLSLTCVFF